MTHMRGAKKRETTHILYRFFNASGELLYIGVTQDPQARFKSHQYDKSWFSEVASSTMEHFSSRQELIAAELAAIRRESPKYNVAGTWQPKPPPKSELRLRKARAQVQSVFGGDANNFQSPDSIADDDPPPEFSHERYPCLKCRRFFVYCEVDADGIPTTDTLRCFYCETEWSDAEWTRAIIETLHTP